MSFIKEITNPPFFITILEKKDEKYILQPTDNCWYSDNGIVSNDQGTFINAFFKSSDIERHIRRLIETTKNYYNMNVNPLLLGEFFYKIKIPVDEQSIFYDNKQNEIDHDELLDARLTFFPTLEFYSVSLYSDHVEINTRLISAIVHRYDTSIPFADYVPGNLQAEIKYQVGPLDNYYLAPIQKSDRKNLILKGCMMTSKHGVQKAARGDRSFIRGYTSDNQFISIMDTITDEVKEQLHKFVSSPINGRDDMVNFQTFIRFEVTDKTRFYTCNGALLSTENYSFESELTFIPIFWVRDVFISPNLVKMRLFLLECIIY